MNFKVLVSILLFSVLIQPISATNILLRNGETIKGKVVSQDDLTIQIVPEGGSPKYLKKSEVLKVVYKEVSEMELKNIRLEEEKKIRSANKQSPSKENEKFANTSEKNLQTITLNLNQTQICEPYSMNSQWYWLYGNFRMTTEEDWNQILPKDGRSVKMKQTSTWKDTLITIFIGSLTSITRRTTLVEVCDSMK
ncbi:hypothetical protein EHQ46_08965 [Leptospira yanagawae]|uniref:Uncharacterized protein n=1 Tax=Leptospira yanagawae TaxID=293069 RepID=A0ABY2M1I1_9LEPT|nr:hypothetical protein [Leptospira yanagawae]TGL21069.1 hypothetical protein EHQ46_08965 [Leptospira yanagawae]